MNDTAELQREKSVDADSQHRANPSPRILVAEDEDVLRRLIANSLIESGYEVDAAEDGAAAWEALQTKHYDLVITDNSMPKVTGIALVKMLRNRDATLPVVMVSGLKPSDDPNWHPSLGISAVLLKPFGLGTLRDTVEHVLRAAVPAAM
jgi:two-component system capsular synthesis sensor histidine kinase RcsC